MAAANLKAFYIGLGAIALIGGGAMIYARSGASTGPRTATDLPAADPGDTTTASGYVFGSDSAKVEIAEYADFECPACQNFAVLTMPDIRDRFVSTGLVRWRFYDFPLSMHTKTGFAHEGAACVAEQGRFWEMHDQLYFNQNKWVSAKNSAKAVRELAKTAGANLSKYDDCVGAHRYQKRIDASVRQGTARGVNSTPTFIINNQIVEGVITFDSLQAVIRRAIDGKPKKS